MEAVRQSSKQTSKQARNHKNSRTNNSTNKRPPRQTAIRPARNDIADRPQPSPITAATRSAGPAVRSGEDGDGDEGPDEAEIQEHQRPAD